MEMSKVKDCDATKCVYNEDHKCHTLAINVGEKEACNTFMASEVKHSTGNKEEPGVGSCKAEDCAYNTHLECTADEGVHMHLTPEGHVDCTTYKKAK